MLQLRDIMTRDVLTVTPEMTLRQAMALFTSRHVSGAPVVEGGRVVGVVSATDLMELAAALPVTTADGGSEWSEWADPLTGFEMPEGEDPTARYFSDLWADARADVSEQFLSAERPTEDVLGERSVGDAMTRTLYALPPEASAEEAAAFMKRVGAHRILVMRDDELLGIVTAMDVTRAVAEHRLTTRTYVFNRSRDFDVRGWR